MTQVLLTYEQVEEWRRRLKAIEDEEARLEEEKQKIGKKLQAVEFLLEAEVDSAKEPKLRKQEVGHQIPEPRTREGRATWPSEITRIFEEIQEPLTFDQLRYEIEKGELKGEYEKSSKGFYHAISRLQSRGYLKKHKGWLFRVSDYEDHMERVHRGEVKDVVDIPSSSRKSPMGEEVKEFLKVNPDGVTNAEVIDHLIKDDRFVDTLTKNKTGAYNVISRLAKRGEIIKRGKKVFPLQENEPPEGGSEAGEAPTSSEVSEQDDRGDLLSYQS